MNLKFITDKINFDQQHAKSGANLHKFNGHLFFFEGKMPVIFLHPVDGIRQKDLIALKTYIKRVQE